MSIPASRGLEPQPLAGGQPIKFSNSGAACGNRTRVTCLEGRGSTIELRPHLFSKKNPSQALPERGLSSSSFDPSRARLLGYSGRDRLSRGGLSRYRQKSMAYTASRRDGDMTAIAVRLICLFAVVTPKTYSPRRERPPTLLYPRTGSGFCQ